MDFNRKQLDLLSLGYFRGVILYKNNLLEQEQFRIN